MKYPLLIASCIKTKTKDKMVVLTFYPSDAACIMPLKDEMLIASYVKHFEPGIELADALSEKGKRRLKILLRNAGMNDDERRVLGTLYYNLCFGHNPGNDEFKKGGADALYETICDLYKTDAASEQTWAKACAAAVATFRRLSEQHYVHIE